MTIKIRNKYLRLLVSAAGVILAGSLYYYASLEMAYFKYPQKPDAQTGYTIPYQVKGRIVFIKSDEERLMYRLTWIGVVSGGLLLAMIVADGILEGMERLRRRDRPDSQS